MKDVISLKIIENLGISNKGCTHLDSPLLSEDSSPVTYYIFAMLHIKWSEYLESDVHVSAECI